MSISVSVETKCMVPAFCRWLHLEPLKATGCAYRTGFCNCILLFAAVPSWLQWFCRDLCLWCPRIYVSTLQEPSVLWFHSWQPLQDLPCSAAFHGLGAWWPLKALCCFLASLSVSLYPLSFRDPFGLLLKQRQISSRSDGKLESPSFGVAGNGFCPEISSGLRPSRHSSLCRKQMEQGKLVCFFFPYGVALGP